MSSPYIDDAIDRYQENPQTALMVVAIRYGYWLADDWQERALDTLRQVRAEQRKGAA